MRGKRPRASDEPTLPDIKDDADERKRVLNVLAQRRYRQRKRERVAALEAQLKEKDRSNRSTSSDSTRNDDPSTPATESLGSGECLEQQDARLGREGYIYPASPGTVHRLQEAIQDTLAPGPALSSESESGFIDPKELQEFIPPGSSSLPASEDLFNPNLDSCQHPLPTFDVPQNEQPGDISALTFQFLGKEMTVDELPTRDLSSTLQNHQSSTFTFPDDYLIETPTLTLLRAMLTIAKRLNLTEYIWNANGISPLYTGPRDLNNFSSPQSGTPQPSSGAPSATDFEDLPAHMRPTAIQRLIPHHAVLDLMPWPTTRDKLIQVFSVPLELRPPAAADPLGLIGLVYDLEDPAEGMRVSGSDPFALDRWEVGQHVFRRWWWAFEGSIVESSNQLRKERGAQGLVLGDVS